MPRSAPSQSPRPRLGRTSPIARPSQPPSRAPTMPSTIVTKMPPGSRPGITSLARAPTINPKMIQPKMLNIVISPVSLRVAVGLCVAMEQPHTRRRATALHPHDSPWEAAQSAPLLTRFQARHHFLDASAAYSRPSRWPQPPRYFSMLRLGCPPAGWPFPGSQSK